MEFLRKYNRNRWNLAFFPKDNLREVLNGNFSEVHWMKYEYRDRWFADPFILSVDDYQIEVLVEELSYSINRGRLARLTINRETWELTNMKIILDIDTHLSFPMIYRRENDVVIIPENSASGKSIAYCYDSLTDLLTPISVICDEPLTDATLYFDFGRPYMFSTSSPNSNGCSLDIYSFDEKKLKATKIDTITFDRPIARNAGAPIMYEGHVYRPAQDCDGAYGKGVILQRINYDQQNAKFDFSDEASIYPFTYDYHLGAHTLNEYDGVCVIDARGLLYPTIGRIIRGCLNLIGH